MKLLSTSIIAAALVFCAAPFTAAQDVQTDESIRVRRGNTQYEVTVLEIGERGALLEVTNERTGETRREDPRVGDLVRIVGLPLYLAALEFVPEGRDAQSSILLVVVTSALTYRDGEPVFHDLEEAPLNQAVVSFQIAERHIISLRIGRNTLNVEPDISPADPPNRAAIGNSEWWVRRVVAPGEESERWELSVVDGEAVTLQVRRGPPEPEPENLRDRAFIARRDTEENFYEFRKALQESDAPMARFLREFMHGTGIEEIIIHHTQVFWDVAFESGNEERLRQIIVWSEFIDVFVGNMRELVE